METTMKDEAHIERERQKQKAEGDSCRHYGFGSHRYFFLPYVSYTFRDSNFVLSAYQILTSPGIRFQDYLISIPLLSKNRGCLRRGVRLIGGGFWCF